MNVKRKILIAEKTLSVVHGWMKVVDQKVDIFLAFQGIILTLSLPNYLRFITTYLQKHTINYLDGFLITGTIVFLALAVYNSIDAIFPRLGDGKKQKSLLYFRSIAEMTQQEFSIDMKKLGEDEYLTILLDEIYINAKITTAKYTKFSNSVISFLVALACLGGTFIALGT